MCQAALTACVRQPQFVVITATITPGDTRQHTPLSTNTPSINPDIVVFPTPSGLSVSPDELREYIVQPGDTLSGIAAEHGVSVATLLSVNEIPDPNLLEVGQVIQLPIAPAQQTPDLKLIPDSRLVRGPGSTSFDLSDFINKQSGYIHIASDTVDDTLLSGIEVVQRVSLEFSVDARLLLALLEYRSNWLSKFDLDESSEIYPIQREPSPDGIDRSGLYRQLAWAANQLNRGYYGWKYNGLTILEFTDGTRMRYAFDLNAGTVGIQYFFSLVSDLSAWIQSVRQDGFLHIYAEYFGDPFSDTFDPLVPQNLMQPDLGLPFPPGETWFFTGGPHGGWGTGSAWGAVDFAPPDDRPDGSPPCYVSLYWATALAPGVVARSRDGVVILDLDGDGNEATGWSILYLHIAAENRAPEGQVLNTGDPIGHPSCEGGFSNATHMHLARRYNGEWIPVDCDACSQDENVPPFVLNGWILHGLPNQEYQGYMVKNGEQRIAEQGRLAPENRVSW
jgi:LysM repeat protein